MSSEGYEGSGGSVPTRQDGMAQAVLLVVAVGVAWFPVETHSLAAVLIAAVVLALSTWGWRHSSRATLSGLAGGAVEQK